jgi:hypothetical protein
MKMFKVDSSFNRGKERKKKKSVVKGRGSKMKGRERREVI